MGWRIGGKVRYQDAALCSIGMGWSGWEAHKKNYAHGQVLFGARVYWLDGHLAHEQLQSIDTKGRDEEGGKRT